MKTLDFLTEYFNFYYPLNTNIYAVIFVLMEKNEINDKSKVDKFITNISENITRNDINLLMDFAMDLRNSDLLSRLEINCIRLFSPNILKQLLNSELSNMMYLSPDYNKKKQFKLLQYCYPFQNSGFDLKPYFKYEARIFYFIRKQLILCNSKKEMIEKLKYNEEFKFYVTTRFYHEDKEIINQKGFENRVYKVCNEIVNILEMEEEDAYATYKKNFEDYQHFLKRYFGFFRELKVK